MLFRDIISVGAIVSFKAVSAQLTHTVPPPPCLRQCMASFADDCNLCNETGQTAIRGCLSSVCGPKDFSYASTYFGSICPEGGYVSFETDPHTFIEIPPADCPAQAPALKKKMFAA